MGQKSSSWNWLFLGETHLLLSASGHLRTWVPGHRERVGWVRSKRPLWAQVLQLPHIVGLGESSRGASVPGSMCTDGHRAGCGLALVGLPRSRAVVLKLTDLGTLESFCFICGPTTLAEVLQVCTGNSDQLATRWWTLHEKELSCKKAH